MSSQLVLLSADVRREAPPVLSSEQVSRIRSLSKVRQVKVGESRRHPVRAGAIVHEGSISIYLVHRVLLQL